MGDRTRVVAERSYALRAIPAAAPWARAVLRDLLRDTAFAERLGDGELAASELVTNAVLHGRADHGRRRLGRAASGAGRAG